MTTGETGGSTPTLVRGPAWLRYGAWVAGPLLGAGAMLLLSVLAGWLATAPWAPWQGAFRLVASVPESWAVPGALAVGALLGLGLATYLAVDSLAVTVTADEVNLRRAGAEQRIARAGVSAVFVERRTVDKNLVLLDPSGAELARERYEASDDRLREAFSAHFYPWCDGDPHADEYRMWVPDTPGLGDGVNAVFAARQRALDKGKDGDTKALRAELGKLGVVVRDEKKRQYWRATSNGSD